MHSTWPIYHGWDVGQAVSSFTPGFELCALTQQSARCKGFPSQFPLSSSAVAAVIAQLCCASSALVSTAKEISWR